MLLAIADFADDDGRAYPAVPTLAKKCRMKPRNTNYVLAALKSSGELHIGMQEGPRGTNLYRIALNRLGVQSSAPLQSVAPLQGSAPTPAKDCSKPLQPVADEPSLNHQEPSGRSLARLSRLPSCPIAEIVKRYHDVLPELPQVRLLETKGRKESVAKFWRWVLTSIKTDGSKRAADSTEALAWIRTYFERVRHNDFLMGRSSRSASHSSWRCDFDYLLSDKGKTQVIEKTEAA